MLNMNRLIIILSLIAVLTACTTKAPTTYTNPIIPGYHPDPSICRVDDTYYLVNSSFEWFPGLPIHKSKDLVNWELIGYVIERPGQITEKLNLWAPTIRYHDGIFYAICTEIPGIVFYCTATDPAGEWSDAVYFDIDRDSVSPIDPSLYWDENGTCWLAANDRVKSGTSWHWCWIQKVDLTPVKKNNRLEATFIGERNYITMGSQIGNDKFAEGPHIFNYNDMFYMVIAEGGTWGNHAVSFLRTNDLNNPKEKWEYHPNNPVLTHRDKKSAISATGHADLVETQNGEWWSVHLGVRKQEGKHKLGRETFLVPVKWEQDSSGEFWPYYNPDKGNMTLLEDLRPDLPWSPVKSLPVRDEFDSEKLRLEYNYYGQPADFDWHEIKDGKLVMNILPKETTSRGGANTSLILRRQQHHNFDVSSKMHFTTNAENEVAGIIAHIKGSNQIRLEISKSNNKTYATVYYVNKQNKSNSEAIEIPEADDVYILKLEARGWDFQFYAGTNEENLQKIGPVQDAGTLSSEEARGFTGSYVGMFATSKGKPSNNKVLFDWFEYKPIQE